MKMAYYKHALIILKKFIKILDRDNIVHFVNLIMFVCEDCYPAATEIGMEML